MEKFLYLKEAEWADTWVNGGSVPIKLASSYLNHERYGTLTPDENLIHTSKVNIASLKGQGIHIEDCKNIILTNCTGLLGKIPDIVNADYYHEDGLILSFCNKKSHKICKRLEKKACVKIRDIHKLKQHIDSQLGIAGKIGPCRYTKDHQRNHFLKSTEDAWQDEFRIFWPILEEKNVLILKGTARYTKMKC